MYKVCTRITVDGVTGQHLLACSPCTPSFELEDVVGAKFYAYCPHVLADGSYSAFWL